MNFDGTQTKDDLHFPKPTGLKPVELAQRNWNDIYCSIETKFPTRLKRSIYVLTGNVTVSFGRTGWSPDCVGTARQKLNSVKTQITRLHSIFLKPVNNNWLTGNISVKSPSATAAISVEK